MLWYESCELELVLKLGNLEVSTMLCTLSYLCSLQFKRNGTFVKFKAGKLLKINIRAGVVYCAVLRIWFLEEVHSSGLGDGKLPAIA